MEATRQLIVHRSDQARLEMLGKEDMENVSVTCKLRALKLIFRLHISFGRRYLSCGRS